MKTMIALALTLVTASVNAGSFNDWGESFTASVQSTIATDTTPCYGWAGSFNDRGELYPATVSPAGSRPLDTDIPAALESFDERSGERIVNSRTLMAEVAG